MIRENVKVNQTKQAIAKAKTVQESLKIKVFLESKYREYQAIYQKIDKVETAKDYGLELKESLVVLGELRVLNEMKLGELLKSVNLSKGAAA
jgi:hypothetical protein